jgi:hypothetical protein
LGPALTADPITADLPGRQPLDDTRDNFLNDRSKEP